MKKVDILENLKNAILQSNISITKISKDAQISRNMIYKILNKDVYSVSLGTIEAICNAINYNVDFIINGEINTTKKTAVKIPVLGSIPAGIPLEAIQDIIDYEEISEALARSGEFFALKVKGDSMAPTILNGDIVIVRKQEDADSGSICVVMINGYDATLKEIKKELGGIWILPRNPNSDFKPTFYSNEEIESLPIRILGVAIEIRRSL